MSIRVYSSSSETFRWVFRFSGNFQYFVMRPAAMDSIFCYLSSPFIDSSDRSRWKFLIHFWPYSMALVYFNMFFRVNSSNFQIIFFATGVVMFQNKYRIKKPNKYPVNSHAITRAQLWIYSLGRRLVTRKIARHAAGLLFLEKVNFRFSEAG